MSELQQGDIPTEVETQPVVETQAPQEEVVETPQTQTPEDEAEAKLHEAVERRKDDTAELIKYAQDMVEAKKKANKEAKELREAYEALQAKVETEERQRKQAEMTEMERLQAEIQERDRRIQEYEAAVARKEAEAKEQDFQLQIEKFQAKDADIVRYFVDKHLAELPEDEREYETANFKLDLFLGDLKKRKPDLFKSALPLASKKESPEATKAQTGTPPQEEKPDDKIVKVPPISKSKKDAEDLEALWQATKSPQA